MIFSNANLRRWGVVFLFLKKSNREAGCFSKPCDTFAHSLTFPKQSSTHGFFQTWQR
jgi:hypothetical protein